MTTETVAWRIAEGACQRLILPEYPGNFYVPEAIDALPIDTDERVPICLLPGQPDPDYEMFSLPLVKAIATRITPWSTWYLAATWSASSGFAGQAWGEREIAICTTTTSPHHAVSHVYHEA